MSDAYDAGLLSDFGGGNVEWWWDYIRAELDRAHAFYSEQTLCEPAEALAVLQQFNELLALAIQYRDDLRHPPTADSIPRRLAAIEAVLVKLEI